MIDKLFFVGTERDVPVILNISIIVLIIVMTIVTIINTPKWYKLAKNDNEDVGFIHIMVGISYLLVLFLLVF